MTYKLTEEEIKGVLHWLVMQMADLEVNYSALRYNFITYRKAREELEAEALSEIKRIQNEKLEGLRERLVKWVTDYKDVAERNALAEEPDESVDYLISKIKEVLEL